MNNIDGTERIEFYRARGKYDFLSNLYKLETPMIFEGREFPTSEHAYQFGKPNKEEIKQWMMEAPYPHLVAIVAHGLFGWDIVEKWSSLRVDRMLRVLRSKFTDPGLKQKLLETGDAILIEKSKTDSFWGTGKKGNGKNMLGKSLMKVRDEIKEEEV